LFDGVGDEEFRWELLAPMEVEFARHHGGLEWLEPAGAGLKRLLS